MRLWRRTTIDYSRLSGAHGLQLEGGMWIRAHVYAWLALLVAVPAGAAAAVTVATTTIRAPAGEVPAGATIAIACQAEGNTTTGGMQGTVVTTIDRIDVAVTGGTVTPAQLTGAVSRTCTSGTGTCSWLEGPAAWTTPSTPGLLTATCTVTYTSQGTFGGPSIRTVSSSATLTTVASATLPPVAGAIGGPGEVVAGSVSTFDLVASDPNTPPLPLSYAWSATGGTLAAAGGSASWTAPSAPGVYTIVATVSNGATSVQSRKSVSVVLAARQAALPLALGAPRRICTDGSGAVYAVDGQQGEQGRVALVTARGEVRGFAILPEPALAVASGAGLLWVTTTKGSIYKVDPANGRTVGKLALAGGPFARPFGIAYDAANMALWVADPEAGRVRVVRLDGATLAVIDAAGGAPLGDPVDVAIDGSSGRAWILRGSAKTEGGLAAGEPIAAARFLHAFDLAGGHLASFVASGGGPGQLTRAGGLAVGPEGKVYASDIFQGTVQVLNGAGQPVGTVGTFGGGEGQLLNPMGLAFLGNGDLAVANTSRGRIERYGTGAPLPTCPGDSDCDGLPDAWELANRLNPFWAGDALVDLDGDGLTNAEELAHGTNPRNADTDGDGFSDGDEVLADFDPRNPNDHRPAVAVSGPAETPPGLVRLSATAASGQGTCAIRWTQKAGPSVTLRGSATGSPSFVARTAAAYDFEAVATCGGVASDPGRLRVAVTNVPPLADAGRILVVPPGTAVRLDALASSDANGDALSFTWDQALGPPVTGTEAGGILTARTRGEGLYVFQLTASDAAGASSIAEVPVLVAEEDAPTAIAAARPVKAEAGGAIVLDASASLADDDASFSWRQVAGPEVALRGADRQVASFVAPAAGRYAFEVSVRDDGVRSPPARVETFVAEAGRPLPAVTAAAPAVVAVNTPASLEASATGTAPAFSWRQLSGPAAGLTDAGHATATAVPFAPGFYVFEVSVRDGAAEGRPARVAFEARAGGRAIPVARAVAVGGEAWVGQLVFLDGRASSGAARFRWTQVEGPWVALGGQAAVTTFRPLAAGRYAFELEVDDGAVRSAPARVVVNVVEGPDDDDEDEEDAEGVR